METKKEKIYQICVLCFGNMLTDLQVKFHLVNWKSSNSNRYLRTKEKENQNEKEKEKEEEIEKFPQKLTAVHPRHCKSPVQVFLNHNGDTRHIVRLSERGLGVFLIWRMEKWV